MRSAKPYAITQIIVTGHTRAGVLNLCLEVQSHAIQEVRLQVDECVLCEPFAYLASDVIRAPDEFHSLHIHSRCLPYLNQVFPYDLYINYIRRHGGPSCPCQKRVHDIISVT